MPSSKVDHGDRGHSKLGASGASRWMACPASVKNLADNPMPSSPAAADGTKTHELSEPVLLQALEGGGVVVPAGIEDDRRERIKYYVDTVLSIKAELEDDLDFDDEFDEVQHWVETGFALDNLHPLFFGTNDCALYCNGVLHVIDLKDGRGEVGAEGNPQLMYYALGIIKEAGLDEEVHTVELHIVQPKLNPDERHKRWVCPEKILKEFIRALITAADRVKKQPDLCVQGESQCKWCNTATCAGYKKSLKAKALTAFDDSDIDMLDALENDDTPRLLKLVALKERFNSIFDAASATIKQRALKGEAVEGFKLVRAQGNRSWIKSDNEVAKLLVDIGVSVKGLFTSKLKSPTQVAAANPKLDLSKFVHRADKGLNLVKSTAKGEAVSLGPAFSNDGIEGLE